MLANSPAAGVYERVRDYAIGTESPHLHLNLGAWAADGLLAIFSFVVGLLIYLRRGEFSTTTEWSLGIVLLIGLLCQSAGCFLHLAAPPVRQALGRHETHPRWRPNHRAALSPIRLIQTA